MKDGKGGCWINPYDTTEICEWIQGYKLSNCCCAPIRFSDICSACGEHCEEIGEEDES